jgi:NCS1 nucleoside transporter family
MVSLSQAEPKVKQIKEEETVDVYVSNTDTDYSNSKSIWHYLQLASNKLDSFGIETRGIERILPYERSTNNSKQLLSVMGLWVSAAGGLSSMSSFYLGPLLFDLGLKKCLIFGTVAQTIGCGVAAYCSLMGPRSGCRQMVGARFLFGWWTVKIISVFSICGVLGWSVVNSVVGGEILVSMSNEKIPLSVGIVIITVISLLVSICGIKHLIKFEAFLSIPVILAFLLLYIVSSQKFQYLSMVDGPIDSATLKGNVLSFFSLAYSVTSTWGAIASDYYILFPENTPDLKIFMLTFFGIWIPTTFVSTCGTLIANVAFNYEPWREIYDKYGMGGLLNEAFKPWGGGGKFLLCLIFLSLISNNIINTYSAAFGFQIAGKYFGKVPRWLWAILITIIYLVCALVGRYQFSAILGNFLPMIGYWISMYFIMLLEENMIFRTDRFVHLYTKEFEPLNSNQIKSQNDYISKEVRRNQHYNFEIWNDNTRLTAGYAATVSFLIGAVGAVLAMSQTYWIGPIAKAIGGEYGGDIAMWLCMGFSGIVYPFLRYWELKTFGR